MQSVCPGPGWAVSGYAPPNAPKPPRIAMLASWLHSLLLAGCPGRGLWGYVLLPWGSAPAAWDWLCQGGCPTVGSWSLDLSGALRSLSHCAGGSNTSCTTMLALPSCWSKSTGGAGLEWTKVSAGVPHHTNATSSYPTLSTGS